MRTTKQLTEWCGKIARTVVVSAVMLTTAMAFAAPGDTYVWTGASDALWCNSANWLVNDVVPNDYPRGGEDIVFGPVADGAATTISLAGASEFTTTPTATISLKSVVFKAGAPAYTLGTTADADLVFDLQLNTRVEVEAGVTTPQTIGCRIRAGTSSSSGMPKFVNNGSGLLSLTFSKSGMYNCRIVFLGEGDISVGYAYETIFYLHQNGELQIRGNPAIKGLIAESTSDQKHARRVNVLSGATLSLYEYQNPTFQELADVDIYGAGVLYMYEISTAAGYSFGFNVSPNCTATTRTTFKNQNPASGYLIVKGGGTWALYGPASADASAQSEFRIDGASTLALTNIGAKASADSFLGRNVTNVVFSGTGKGTLLYKGPGETASQDLRLMAAAQATLRNGGTGTLVYDGAVFSTVAGASLLLDAATAPIDFQATTPGPNVPTFAVTGAAGVTLPVSFAADAALSLTDAKVTLTATAASTVKLAFVGGVNEVAMPAGMMTTIAGFAAPASGVRVDFGVPADATVKLAGVAAGFLPDNVTVNGNRGRVLADGSIAACVAKWASAVSGNWNETAKWNGNRLPDATDTTFVDAAGASYTVSVTDASADPVTALKIANAADGETATVGIAADHAVKSGTMVELDRGGVLGTTAADATLTFAPDVRLTVKEGGAWKSSLGTNVWAANTADLAMDGGKIEMTGTASLVMTNAKIIADHPSDVWNRYQTLTIGSGELVFSGDSSLVTFQSVSPIVNVWASSADRTATFTIKDRAHAYAAYANGCLLVGSSVAGRTSVFNHELDEGVSFEVGVNGNGLRGLRIGVENGTGILNLKSGSLNPQNYCTYIGYEARDPYLNTELSGRAGHCPTGIVNQTGGVFNGACYNPLAYSMIIGTTIGGGAHLNVPGSRYTGIWNMSGGTFANNAGHLVIGGGPNGTGVFNLSGGTFTFASEYTYSGKVYHHPLLIGIGGGDGAFRQTGGTASVTKTKVYVGGCRGTDVGFGETYVYNQDARPSVGILDLQGGSFTAVQDVIVGAHGTGTLAVSGSAALTCEANLVLSNRTASALTYALSPARKQSWNVNVAGDLVIAPGSKLVIDVTDLSPESASAVCLLEAGNVVGSFADADVTIAGDNLTPEQQERLRGASVVYERGGQKGLWLKLASRGMLLIVK